ncbi:MAG: hypothetical protein KatS3mg033_0569 [Thermonema sp.]|nr:MAG: hypothetical protein KatS3mg033_0569 [Thermonema sp.]
MNKGIDLAKGGFLLFLGADDRLVEGVLNKVVKMCNWYDFDLIYGKVQYPDGSTIGQPYNAEVLSLKPSLPQFVHHQGAFISKKAFDLLGKYDTRYSINADIVFFVKLLGYPNSRKFFLNEVISYYSTEGISSQNMDEGLIFEFPGMLYKYLGVKVDEHSYFESFNGYLFYQIGYKNPFKGLLNIIKVMYRTGKYRYYLTNTLYWMKFRLINSFFKRTKC